MFTSIRLITAHCTLAALTLAACDDSSGGGGPCGAAGSQGSVTFTFPSGSYAAGCFSATSDGGTVTVTSPAPAAGQTAAVMQLSLQPRDQLRNVCPWYPGASAALASACVTMRVQARNGDSLLHEALGGTAAGLPAPTGTLTVSDWGTGPGQLVSISFSSGAALTSGGKGPDGGTLVPLSGSAATLI